MKDVLSAAIRTDGEVAILPCELSLGVVGPPGPILRGPFAAVDISEDGDARCGLYALSCSSVWVEKDGRLFFIFFITFYVFYVF